jgi:predicted nucleic acid-binding protein
VSRRSVLLDTSFIVALENKDDPHHEGAKALDRELLKEDALLLLHWGILFEMKQEGITEALTADVHFRQAGFTALLLETS